MAMSAVGRGASDWVGDATRAAHTLEEDLVDPARLDAVTDELVQIAHRCGATMVTGASPLGHQLAGLVVGRARPNLALWAQNGARGTVLVVEGVLVSGAQMSSTARRALAAGATRIVGVAVVADSAGLEVCRREIGADVVALQELGQLRP